jgi:hypothetical protein
MKNLVITKKRDGQEAKIVHNLYTFDLNEAKKEFKRMMTSDLYEQEDGSYQDECGNEVWGFGNDDMWFKEDVYTWELVEE